MPRSLPMRKKIRYNGSPSPRRNKGDDTHGVKNFVKQEIEDFKTSKGLKGKAKSLLQSTKQAKRYLKK